MGGSVEPVGAVEAVSYAAAAGMVARQTVERRRRRLRWLAALHEASGGEGLVPADEADDEDDADERLMDGMRERIRAALGTIEEMQRFTDTSVIQAEPGIAVSTADLAFRIGEAGDRSLRMQARIGVAAVRGLVSVNGA
jgi:hypothetical protein